MNRREIFRRKQGIYQKDPCIFFLEVLSFIPDEWQKKVAEDVALHRRVTVRSGQGVGKTCLEAALILWFLTCFPFPRVVATAPTMRQLHDVLWAEVSKWQMKSPLLSDLLRWQKTYICMKNYEKRWFAVARTANAPENMQGFHEENMLFIVDEASGVRDDVMEAILGTLSGENNKLLMCGNPTKTSGVFYDSHMKNRGKYKVHKVSARDSRRTNKENIKALEEDYGKNSNVIRVRVDGEFPYAEDDVFIPLSIVEEAMQSEIPEEVSVLEMGVDVARFGEDSTVIAPKIGQRVYPLIVKHGKDLMWTVGEILKLCLKWREEFPDYKGFIRIKVDDGGLGGGVTDRLKEIKEEKGYEWLYVIPVNFGGKSPDMRYSELSTYMWAMVRKQIKDKELSLPEDQEMIGQFSTRRFSVASGGKDKLESKQKLKERGIKSPDKADAVALACLPVQIRGERRE